MPATRTPGITIGADARYFIDKRYRGFRIGMRMGTVSQQQAEQRLAAQMRDTDVELARRVQRCWTEIRSACISPDVAIGGNCTRRTRSGTDAPSALTRAKSMIY